MNLCECGCGQIAKNRFVHGHNARMPEFLAKNIVSLKEKPRAKKKTPAYIVDEKTGCWEWQRAKIRGYGIINRRDYRMYAHRYYYQKYKGNIPEDKVLDHLCGNPSCVNPDHLEPVTAAENIRRGNKTKLMHEDINKIRKLRKLGSTYTSIAKIYGVYHSTIRNVCVGKTWKGCGCDQ